MDQKRDYSNEAANGLKLVLFCTLIGAAAGMVFWLFLFAVNKGTLLIWEVLPEKLSGFSWYPLAVCTFGGLVTGIFRRFSGDYPEDMLTVFGKLKKNKTYPYQRILVILFAALLPLVFGSSVGPEAGMVGVIAALCCWAGDNLKFAGNRNAYYSRVGAAASLSVMFRSPLFGILDIEEETGDESPAEVDGSILNGDYSENVSLSRVTKTCIYCMAAGAAFGCVWLLNTLFGKISEGFPSFDVITLETWDYVFFLLYLACGIALGIFYEYSEKVFGKVAHALPPVVSETAAGLVLGGTACFLPVILFSGEEQMAVLISDFEKYPPLAMIGIAFLKIVMTSMCIHLGMKGGHFFPLIFSSVCLGYGVALLLFPGNASHAVFAAAVAAAGTLGVSMKKPLAVSLLLLLCFPARALLWIVPSAAISALTGTFIKKKLDCPGNSH